MTEGVEDLRERLSTVRAVIASALLVEAAGLSRETLPWRYAFDTPAISALGIANKSVYAPDFFVLLTPQFWSASLLWTSTSLLLPLLASYFVNLTRKTVSPRTRAAVRDEGQFDPLVFNVVKALVTYLVYAKHVTFYGTWSEETIGRVSGAVWGSYEGILIGAAVGGLVSLYDAVLKK